MTREIPLSQGYVALVDEADYEAVAARKWCASVRKRRVYAVSHRRRGEGVGIIYMHRLIAKPDAGSVVDHVNRNTLDNTRGNLRLATRQQNNFNAGAHADKAVSAPVGVSWAKAVGKWYAKIGVDGRQISLGHHDTLEQAVAARIAGEVKYHGNFAARAA